MKFTTSASLIDGSCFVVAPSRCDDMPETIARYVYAAGDLSTLELRLPFGADQCVLQHLLPHTRRLWINNPNHNVAAVRTAIIKHADQLIERIENFDSTPDAINAAMRFPPQSPNEIVERAFHMLVSKRACYGVDIDSMQRGRHWDGERLTSEIARLNGFYSAVEVRERRCTAYPFDELIFDDSLPALLYIDPPSDSSERDQVRLADLLRKTGHRWLMLTAPTPLAYTLYNTVPTKLIHLHDQSTSEDWLLIGRR